MRPYRGRTGTPPRNARGEASHVQDAAGHSVHLRDMRTHIFDRSLLAALCCLAGAPETQAQGSIALGDSTSRQIKAKSTDSVFVALKDGDYAKLVVSHPRGLGVDVVRPNGSTLKSYVEASMEGVHTVAFAAEGAGRWGVILRNTRDEAVRYGITFQERLPLDDRTRPLPWSDPLASPAIVRIRKAIEAGNANTAEFWRTVAQTGTPLVEPHDASYDLVTFLWRGE